MWEGNREAESQRRVQKPSARGKQEASHGKQSLWIHGMYFGIWGKTDIYQQGLKISGSVSQTMQSHRGH